VNDIALLLNLLGTWMMVGVIWFVQLVHYPLLAVVPVESASTVALDHQRRTAWVVMIPMTVEGFSTLALMKWVPEGVATWMPWANGVFLAIALGCTVLLSVPRHARMAENPTPTIGRELVLTNWPRTIAWTICGLLTAIMLNARL
jgi:hypothetical protein